MIERLLPDGKTTVLFPDSMTESEIEQAIREYLGETPQDTRRDAKGSAGVVSAPQDDQRTQRAPAGSPEAISPAPAPEPLPNGRQWTLRLTQVEPFTTDEDDEREGRRPEQVRERQQRFGRPARRELPDEYSADRFRDNLVASWSIYRPR